MIKTASPTILIVLTASLGDVVRGFAVIKPLKDLYPDSKLVWLIEDKWKSIAERVSGIDELLVFERKQGWAGIKKIYTDLRRRKFDIVLDMQRHFKSGVFSFLSGAKKRIGFHPLNSHEFNFIFNNTYLKKHSENYPKIYQYLEFVEVLGGKWQEPLDFGLLAKRQKVGNKVGIVLGSSKAEKDWPASSYIALIKHLLGETSLVIELIGDGSQVAVANKLLAQFSSERIISLVGKTSLSDLIDVLAGCELVVGPDSGPGHISAAVNTPYIALFGPTNIRRVAPYKNESLAIQTKSKKVSDIAVDDVIKKIEQVIPLGSV